MTLGDEEARRRGTQKTVLERKAPPTFDVVVEIVERDSVIVHRSVAETVDAILRGHMVPPESRWRDENGEVRADDEVRLPDQRDRRRQPGLRSARADRQLRRLRPQRSREAGLATSAACGRCPGGPGAAAAVRREAPGGDWRLAPSETCAIRAASSSRRCDRGGRARR